jgi:hypothetical protein
MAMKAHDVRHLTFCKACDVPGDARVMVTYAGGLWHDACLYRALGDRILQLPASERAKFTLGSIGPAMMKRLVDSAPAGRRRR